MYIRLVTTIPVCAGSLLCVIVILFRCCPVLCGLVLTLPPPSLPPTHSDFSSRGLSCHEIPVTVWHGKSVLMCVCGSAGVCLLLCLCVTHSLVQELLPWCLAHRWWPRSNRWWGHSFPQQEPLDNRYFRHTCSWIYWYSHLDKNA